MKRELFIHHVVMGLVAGGTCICIVGGLAVSYIVYSQQRATSPRPVSKFSTLLTSLPPLTVALSINDKVFATPSASLLEVVPPPTPKAVSATYEFFSRSWGALQTPPPHPAYRYNDQALQAWIEEIAKQTNVPASPAAIRVSASTKVPPSIFVGSLGTEVDIEQTKKDFIAHDFFVASTSAVVLHQTGAVLDDTQVQTAQHRMEQLLKVATVFTAGGHQLKLAPQDIATVTTLPTGFSAEKIAATAAKWSKDISAPPQEPELELDGTIVKKFTPPRDGLGIDPTQTAAAIQTVLEKADQGELIPEKSLAFTTLPPTHKLSDLNTLGITELIGRGDSAYSHSIPGRIHNVALTTERVSDHIIPAGETFSFNTLLGEVSAATGFKPAYVIMQGQTVLGDGGGVCQVSSTTFRAILKAGLPITERRGHSYRVSYYEQNSKPGFDATVYGPHPDLRFINDTGHAILIHGKADSKNLTMYMELWGTSDGRTAEVLNYKQWGAQPAPPPVYQDDPTLRPGQLKQIDYAAPGLKTSFEYKVTYPDGTVKDKTFTTNYIPWRAVYLRGV